MTPQQLAETIETQAELHSLWTLYEAVANAADGALGWLADESGTTALAATLEWAHDIADKRLNPEGR